MIKRWRQDNPGAPYVVGIALAIAVFATAILSGLLGTQAQVGANLPFATGVTVQNAVTTIVGPNPTRHGLKICNVGATNDVWIAPTNVTGTPVTPAALGPGSFLLSRNPAAGVNVTPNCINMPADVGGAVATSGFAGITNAGTTPVTAWEY